VGEGKTGGHELRDTSLQTLVEGGKRGRSNTREKNQHQGDSKKNQKGLGTNTYLKPGKKGEGK